MEPGSFDEGMRGCSIVFHVASPFLLEEKIKDGQKEVVDPAINGTKNVLDSVARTDSVKLVVLTSSIGAVVGDYADALPDRLVTEAQFNTTSTLQHNAYQYSKVISEKEAWKRYEAQGDNKRWKLITICPGLIFGPSLSRLSSSGSLFLLDELIRGYMFFGVPDLWFATVDVRDVAEAHIQAAENPTANGRYIVAEKKMTSFIAISRTLRQLCNNSWLLPVHNIPGVIVRFLGPLFGLKQKWISLNLGISLEIDNHRSIEELGVKYRPLEETLHDHYQSWLTQNAK